MDSPRRTHRVSTRSPDRRGPEFTLNPRSRSPPRHHSSRHGHGHHRSSRRRSPSPSPKDHDRDRDRDRERHRHRRHHHRDERKRTRTPSPAAATTAPAPAPVPVLPFNAPPITKHALAFPHVLDVFGNYLDVQKGLSIADLDSRETKGRFKRFVHHYNRGELASGWYSLISQEDTTTTAAAPVKRDLEVRRPEKKKPRLEEPAPEPELEHELEEDESEDEVVGPFLPGQAPKRARVGPAIPTVEDLDLQRELLADDATLARADLRFDRKQDRTAQREALDELLPRAAAGTHERRLEKKKEVNDKMRAFRDKSPDGEVDDSTLMGGGGEGGTEGFKQKKAALERKKNDRELRKEQLLRARIAEREERLQMHRVKEEKTMAMLKTLATRFQ